MSKTELAEVEKNLPVSAKELKAYEEKMKEDATASFPAQRNYIHVNYNDESPNYGKLVLFNQGDTEGTLIGEAMTVTVLAIRRQYQFYPLGKDGKVKKEEIVRTDLFEGFQDEVGIYNNGTLLEKIKGVSHWIKEKLPEAKYREVLFLNYKGSVYMLAVKGSSLSSWFDYRKETQGRVPFAYETEIKVSKAKKGTVVYFPLIFSRGKDHVEADYKNFLKESFNTARSISVLNQLNAGEQIDEILTPDVTPSKND